jgi:hypothetical protein
MLHTWTTYVGKIQSTLMYLPNCLRPHKLYVAMKAYAKTFTVGDSFDMIACSRFFSLWFSAFESSNQNE